MPTIKLNDQNLTIAEQQNLAGLLQELGYVPNSFAVAINQTFVARTDHPATILKDGDELIIVTAMQGG